MGHGTLGKMLNPKTAVSMAIDPAGTAVRTARGVPTTARTIADPGNAVWPQAAQQVNYGDPSQLQQPAINGPYIDPNTNMRAGGVPGTPMATSIGSLGGKNQIPMPSPNAQTPGSGPRITLPQMPTGQRAM